MGTLFRSEEMALCQLFLQSESSYACVAELGELGLVQFRDLNPDVNAFQRKFVNEVRRCEEMERKLRYLEKEIQKDGIHLMDVTRVPEAPQPREMIDLEATFEKLENETREITVNNEALKKNFLELTELKHILRKTQQFFDERDTSDTMNPQQQQQQRYPNDSEQAAIITREQPLAGAAVAANLGFVAGVIQRERIPMFERMLWRVCRGNVFLRHTEIEDAMEDPVTGEKVFKSVFVIFYQGEQLKVRVRKICEGFRATLYPCPESAAERREMAIGVMTRIEDLTTVLGQTQDHRHRVLVVAAQNMNIWFIKVRKIKAIYHTMNMFNLDVTNKCLIAECWVPVANLEHIQMALRRGTDLSGASVPSILNRMDTHETPPTFHRTNKYTEAFQALIDAYGVASYREVNPAPFAIITFPFLFGVMFGDCGHGLLMTLAAAFMIWKEKWIIAQRSEGEILGMIFGGRYILILMGLFSIYAGLMYNDCFGKPINIFGSGWRAMREPEQHANVHAAAAGMHGGGLHDNGTTNGTTGGGSDALMFLDPNTAAWTGDPYPFGLDPMWPLAYNKIAYTNTMKMKLSVIFGFAQMMFGVVLGLFNHRFFKRKLNIFFEFIPQVLFLSCMFGYLVVLIFAKWITYGPWNSDRAPQLLNTLINMFLLKMSDPSSRFYPGQQVVQAILLIILIICVPWMLIFKPYFQIKEKKARTRIAAHAPLAQHDDNGHAVGTGGGAFNGTDPTRPGLDTNGTHGYGTEIGGTGVNENTPGSAVHHAPSAEGAHGGGHDEEGTGDIVIHQAIHTIEYCLGCISNTASYLRLWALSLAHSQLSEVLWTMVLHQGFAFSSKGVGIGCIITVAVFAAWAVLTVAILVAMEGMSAFLHALRLHWVEFDNKFYLGDGYPFMPFNFKEILEHRLAGTQFNTALGGPNAEPVLAGSSSLADVK